MLKCALIVNPNSGKGIKMEQVEKIVSILYDYKYKTTLHLTKGPGHAKEIVKDLSEVDLVLSIGGDGTFNEVVSGDSKRKKKLVLAHIPYGTANDLGAMFGLGKNLEQNAKDILNGVIKQVDVGMINNQPFVYVAGFGKFITIPYETPRHLKKTFGYLAYMVNAIKDFFSKTKAYYTTMQIDNNKVQGKYSLILVSNATGVAGFNNIYKNVKLDDDKLEIICCTLSKRNAITKALIQLVREKNIKNIEGMEFYKGTNIEINFDLRPKKHWTIDGEELLDDRNTFKIKVNKHIKMLLPTNKIDELFTKKQSK